VSEQLPHDEELRSLYRKLPADEPRAEVDEAILAAAREAAARGTVARGSGDAHARQRRRFLARAAWIVPLATAASVILTVSLTRLSPERPEIEPSSLREAAESDVDSLAAAPAEREDVWPEESPRPAPPAVAAPPPAAAPPPVAAPPRVAEPPRAAAPTTGKQEAERSQPRADAMEAQRGAEATEARRRAEAKAEADAAVGSLAEPLARKKAAEESPAKSAPMGAAKPSESASAVAQDETAAEVGGAPPASPSLPALADRHGDVASRINPPSDDYAIGLDEPAQPQDRARAASTAWPFGLTPGLDAAEACRRLESALKSACRFEGSQAVVAPKDVAVADRGEFAGRRITRVTLVAAGGRLVEIRLQVEGFTSEQILVAPAP
jgi:hypothetical protein